MAAKRKRRLSIEYLSVLDTQPDPDNPKEHDLGALAQSFERFGFVAPAAINEETGFLIYGHGRRDALLQRMEAGLPPLDGIEVSKDGVWLWPVIRGVYLTPDVGKAYVIADNRQTELGGWNEPELVEQLMGLVQSGGDLAGTGYDTEDLDRMIMALSFDEADLLDSFGGAVKDSSNHAEVVFTFPRVQAAILVQALKLEGRGAACAVLIDWAREVVSG